MTGEEIDHPFVIKSEKISSKGFKLGIGYEIFYYMKKNSKKIAQYDVFSNTEETFEALLERSLKVSAGLQAINLPNDSIVALLSTNHADACVPILGTLLAGHKINGYDPFLRDSDLSLLLQQIPPSIMFIDEQFVEKIESAMKLSGINFKLVVFGKSEKHLNFEDFVGRNEDHSDFEPVKLESGLETAVVTFSSGTTGLPKGICLSHDALMEHSHIMPYSMHLDGSSVFLHFSTYNWITSYIFLFSSIISGTSRVITPVSKTWDAIHKYKVTHIYVPPYKGAEILKEGRPNPDKNRSVKLFLTAGSRLNDVLAKELRATFPEALICQSYGQTETAGWITIFRWHNEEEAQLARKNPDSVGRLLPGFYGKIVDLDTEKILGPNQTGEIRLKNELFSMTTYYNRDSSEIYDSSGWLKTGDLGYYDENRCLYIVSRCKELIKYRGFHIRPQKLELILESHPAVDKAVVIGLRHPVDGERAAAVVVLKKGSEDVTPEDLKSLVDDQVEERLKLIGGVLIVEDIPFTSTGKPKREELKKMYGNIQNDDKKKLN